MAKKNTQGYERKLLRVRSKLKAVADKNRLRICFTRSNRYLYVQVIDDSIHQTIFGLSSLSLPNAAKENNINRSNKKYAALLAEAFLAKMSSCTQKIHGRQFYFDRGANKYSLVLDSFVGVLVSKGVF